MSTPFTIGQLVTWSVFTTTSTGSGCSMRIRSLEGKIVAIDGDRATVSRRGARRETIPLSKITDSEEHSRQQREAIAAFLNRNKGGGGQ
jgi:hypothetical protein